MGCRLEKVHTEHTKSVLFVNFVKADAIAPADHRCEFGDRKSWTRSVGRLHLWKVPSAIDLYGAKSHRTDITIT